MVGFIWLVLYPISRSLSFDLVHQDGEREGNDVSSKRQAFEARKSNNTNANS
jgi:hypothetical protein